MTIGSWLEKSTAILSANNVGTARLDSLVLLEDAVKKDRSWLLAHLEFTVNEKQCALLNAQIEQRAKHIPLAYIRGKTGFYGREFILTPAVLEPRPESETMIELLKSLKDIKTIADIGTGSGALAITAKLELPQATVFAVDIDPQCLTVASQNADKHATDIQFLQGDLLTPLLNWHIDALLCNLPYVPEDYQINTAALHEPRIAIFGGKDGLDYYRTLFQHIIQRAQKPLHVLTESLPFQHSTLADIAQRHGYERVKTEDLIQHFKNI